MHALHGNGPRGGDSWTPTHPRGGEPRFLQEPQPASCLRAAGWTLPSHIPPEYPLRVYDTRLEPSWLQSLINEIVPSPFTTHVIGGDFLTPAMTAPAPWTFSFSVVRSPKQRPSSLTLVSTSQHLLLVSVPLSSGSPLTLRNVSFPLISGNQPIYPVAKCFFCFISTRQTARALLPPAAGSTAPSPTPHPLSWSCCGWRWCCLQPPVSRLPNAPPAPR